MCRLSIGFSLLIILTIVSGCRHKSNKSEPVFIDNNLNIMWTGKTSPEPVSWSEAATFARNLEYHGYSDWRLPTKGELESIVNKELVDNDPNSAVFPLYGPFTDTSANYIFSGTVVEGYTDAPYILNTRNGHIFNGKGYKAHVRAVRDIRFKSE
jgi:hypothetical protein